MTDRSRPFCKIFDVLSAEETKPLIDTLHSGSISLSDAIHGATKEEIQLLQRLVLGF